MADNGTIISPGRGIERELIFATFQTFNTPDHANQGAWFADRVEGCSTIAIVHDLGCARQLASVRALRREMDLVVLGALTALMIIHKMCPLPLSPAVIQFVLNNCDLHALHSGFLLKYLPETHSTIRQWLDAGPNGDPSPFQAHFATYHDLQVTIISSQKTVADLVKRSRRYGTGMKMFIISWPRRCCFVPRSDPSGQNTPSSMHL